MKTVRFDCCKIASRIPLNQVASFFRIHFPLSWKDFIVLKDDHLDLILKHKTTSKEAYLFDFGCVAFVNFSQGEIQTFVEYMDSITGDINYSLLARFRESHQIRPNKIGRFKLQGTKGGDFLFDREVIPILSHVLAKSVGLYRMETEVGTLLDESERFIGLLQKGTLRSELRSYLSTVAGILRFEYESIHSLRIFDRPCCAGQSVRYRQLYDALSEYYELHGRFDVLKSKIEDLRGITRAYSTLSYNHHESRLLLFEIFLLALFPLSYLVRYLLL